jgi:hypothetical protein
VFLAQNLPATSYLNCSNCNTNTAVLALQLFAALPGQCWVERGHADARQAKKYGTGHPQLNSIGQGHCGLLRLHTVGGMRQRAACSQSAYCMPHAVGLAMHLRGDRDAMKVQGVPLCSQLGRALGAFIGSLHHTPLASWLGEGYRSRQAATDCHLAAAAGGAEGVRR